MLLCTCTPSSSMLLCTRTPSSSMPGRVSGRSSRLASSRPRLSTSLAKRGLEAGGGRVQGIRVPGYQGIRVSGYQGIRVQGIRVSGSQAECFRVLG